MWGRGLSPLLSVGPYAGKVANNCKDLVERELCYGRKGLAQGR